MRRAFAYLLIGGGTALLLQGGFFFLSQFQSLSLAAFSDEAFERLVHISFPRIGKELYVAPSAGKDDLLRGPGHLNGTALPGEPGNMVIAGHRDTHFHLLKDVKAGDDILIERGWNRFRYRVTETRIVSPTETGVLASSREAILTLVTCYPFSYAGPAPKRYIVRAVLTPQ